MSAVANQRHSRALQYNNVITSRILQMMTGAGMYNCSVCMYKAVCLLSADPIHITCMISSSGSMSSSGTECLKGVYDVS